ncbi:MAG: methylenetetrahydrofolate reductase [NAD(P)H] [bacterium]
MKLKEIYAQSKTSSLSSDKVISFEIFPPKYQSEEDKVQKLDTLFNELKILAEFNPAYISVTYGAGGSTRERSFEIVLKIKNELNICPMPHYTCVGSSKTEISQYLNMIQEAGILNILALRGDPPAGEEKFIKAENGFGYANELVDFINNSTDLGIAVAGYPEIHQECESFEKDIENLKRKVDSGADAIITQLFYDNNVFYNFVEKAQNAGINIPIIPGILPITGLVQIEKITAMCSAKVPETLMQKLRENQDNKETVKNIGLTFAKDQCSDLLKNGVPGIHFYTLNKAAAVKEVIEDIGMCNPITVKQ